MDSNYYEEYFYLEREHWWFKARNQILDIHINSLLKKKDKNYRILNIGAGTGYTSEILSKYGEVKSIEFNEKCREIVMEKTNLSIEYGDIRELNFDTESFDIVTAFDVIEHIDDDRKAFEEVFRVTKKNGLIITSVPAFNFLWSDHDEINHHYRRYTKKTFNLLSADLNLKKIYSSYFNFFLFPLICLIRIFSRFKKKKLIKSDFENYNSSFFDKILFKVFSIESFFVKYKVNLPVGVSLLTSFVKK